MCLLVLAYKIHPEYKVILAANRDEFYERPTRALHNWDDEPTVFAGKDLEAGGTWCGINTSGQFAALTNYRDLRLLKSSAPSRGYLVTDYLVQQANPEQYTNNLSSAASVYNGYNIITGTTDECWYYSNMLTSPQQLQPGLYGLSNHLLDTPWFKVEKIKHLVLPILHSQTLRSPMQLISALFEMLCHNEQADESVLPDTGIGLEMERVLSSMFICSPRYGTRSSSVLLINNSNEIYFSEQTFANPFNTTPGILHYTISSEHGTTLTKQ